MITSLQKIIFTIFILILGLFIVLDADASQVLPSLSRENSTYLTSFNWENFSNLTTAHSFTNLSNFKDVFFSKFEIEMSYALVLSILFYLIFHIVLLGSKKQMIWPNASSIVAFMKNKKSFWDRSIMNYPRNPMGIFSPLKGIITAISMMKSISRPLPTLMKRNYFDKIKKGFVIVFSHVLLVAIIYAPVKSNAQSYIKGPALIEGVTVTATAAGTTTLTKDSQTNQIFTGVTTQTVVLPDATTIPIGRRFYIANRSTGAITLRDGTPTTIRTMIAGVQLRATLRAQGSAGGTWDLELIKVDLGDPTNITGILPIANGGTNQSSFTSPAVVYFDGTRLTGDATNFFYFAGITGPVFTNGLVTNSFIFEEPGAGTDQLTISAAAAITPWTWTLPPNDGAANQFMQTDGSGVTTWETVDASTDITGVLPLANGGTNKNMTASAGAVAYSDADSLELTAVGSSLQVLQSAGTGTPTWSTATYPATTTASQLLYSSSNNVVAGLATANAAALITNGTGVPSLSASSADGQVLRRAAGAIAFGAVDLADTDAVTGILALANGGTNKNMTAVNGGVVWTDADSMEVTAAGTSGQLLQSNGAAAPSWTNSPATSCSVRAVSSTDSTTTSDCQIHATSTFTLTLNTVSGNSGQALRIKNAGTGVITLDGTSTELIEGELTQTLEAGDAVNLYTNGTAWFVQ